MLKQLVLIVTTLVGAMFCAGTSPLLEKLQFKVAAIRHERYYEVMIKTDNQDSYSPCTMIVENHQMKLETRLSLPNHMTTIYKMDFHQQITLTCDNEHAISFTIPDPKCSEPPEINYGSRTHDGRRATYTCGYGYILQGNPILTCSIKSGIWSPEPPICSDGENNHSLSNQSDQLPYPLYGDYGNIAFVSKTVTPSCEHPGMLANGWVDARRGTAVGEGVYYKCNKGFTLKGDSFRICQEDYTWSGIAPVCAACWLQIQLYGGTHRCEGRLRVNSFGFWEAIYTTDFPDTAKQVICRQLVCGDLIPGGTLQVESPTLYLFSNNYKCNGNERSLCECENTEGFGSPLNTASSTVNIQCEERQQQGDISGYIKDPVIELKGGQDLCEGQVIMREVTSYLSYHGEAVLCDKEATLEMANVICRQVVCGPPEDNPPFKHEIIWLPPSDTVDSESGFKCTGCEPGLGYCNPTQPNCPSTDYALTLTCAKPDNALTKKGVCSPVKYTPRPFEIIQDEFEYTCEPIEDIHLCPNIVDVNGRCCKGLATTKNVRYICFPKIGRGKLIKGLLPKSDYTYCGFG